MTGLDSAAERWQKQVSAIDVGRLRISYAKGKVIEEFRSSTLSDLESLRSSIAHQRLAAQVKLSGDIEIEETMGDVYIGLQDLLEALPSDDEGSFQQGSLIPAMKELQDQRFPLRWHVNAYADKLQSKADSCPK